MRCLVPKEVIILHFWGLLHRIQNFRFRDYFNLGIFEMLSEIHEKKPSQDSNLRKFF